MWVLGSSRFPRCRSRVRPIPSTGRVARSHSITPAGSPRSRRPPHDSVSPRCSVWPRRATAACPSRRCSPTPAAWSATTASGHSATTRSRTASDRNARKFALDDTPIGISDLRRSRCRRAVRRRGRVGCAASSSSAPLPACTTGARRLPNGKRVTTGGRAPRSATRRAPRAPSRSVGRALHAGGRNGRRRHARPRRARRPERHRRRCPPRLA